MLIFIFNIIPKFNKWWILIWLWKRWHIQALLNYIFHLKTVILWLVNNNISHFSWHAVESSQVLQNNDLTACDGFVAVVCCFPLKWCFVGWGCNSVGRVLAYMDRALNWIPSTITNGQGGAFFNPTTQEVEAGGLAVEDHLQRYRMSLRTAWVIWDHVYKNKEKNDASCRKLDLVPEVLFGGAFKFRTEECFMCTAVYTVQKVQKAHAERACLLEISIFCCFL